MKELPELFDLRIKARALAYLFEAGAALAALTLLLPHDEAFRDLQLWIVISGAAVIGALLYWSADRVGEWQVHLGLAAGTTLLGLVRHHAIDAHAFLRETHAFVSAPTLGELIRAERGLGNFFRRLPGRKVLITNAPAVYAQRVLKEIGLSGDQA